jgi:hypothetical protein
VLQRQTRAFNLTRQRQLGRTGTHDVVGLAGPGFGERDHAHANDVNCALANGHAYSLNGFDRDKVSSGSRALPIANQFKMISSK